MLDQFYIGIYDTNRAFGGTEEGGWWYDYGELKHTVNETFYNLTTAYNHARKLQRHLDHRYNSEGATTDLDSVLCEGNLQAEVYEIKLPKFYPDRKPHYS